MPRIAFLFPGQGSQTVGMGLELYKSLPAAKKLFDEASDILGYNLLDVCGRGPAERLNTTAVSQPAIFVASLAALESLRATEPEACASCDAAAGLSLGEYTALAFADALSFADGLRLVQQRGEAMQAAADATPSGMVSVLGLEEDKVAALCDKPRPVGSIAIANLLCPGNIVVSGHESRLRRGRAPGARHGGHEDHPPGGGRRVSHRPHEAGRPSAGGRPGRRPAQGRRVCRSGPTSTPSRTPTRRRSGTCWCGRWLQPVLWEKTHAQPAGPRHRPVLRDRSGPRAGRAAQAA